MTPNLPRRLVFSALLASMGIASADLTCESPMQSFTRVAGDPALRTTYTIRNSGTEAATIRKISTNCSCTTGKTDKQTYAPGESGTLVVEYAYGTKVGPHVKNIVIETEDKKRLTVSVSVTVQPPPVTLAPGLVWWKTGESTAPKAVTIQATGGFPVAATRVTTSDPRLSARLETVQAGAVYRVVITPADTAAKLKATVSVETDYPKDRGSVYTIETRIK
jgi:hypothetical protein